MTEYENDGKSRENSSKTQREIDAADVAGERDEKRAEERVEEFLAEAGVPELDDAEVSDAHPSEWTGASPALLDEPPAHEWNLEAWESAATAFRAEATEDAEDADVSDETTHDLLDEHDAAEDENDDNAEGSELDDAATDELTEVDASAATVEGATDAATDGKRRRRRRGGRGRRPEREKDGAPATEGGRPTAAARPAVQTETHDEDASDAPRRRAAPKPKVLILVNDNPGEEMRIAIIENNTLAQYFSERAATATNVGSIYKARVLNVEPAIQAAFVDFGEGANGFLHVSDLHPKYFPGEERTEKVGRKIPRHDRPMMQHALKRGQEILVQVLKEGLGSKGPTVTSYLSLPGRLLVMMPDMDNIGVSRKVDDEDQRRAMRKILDSLELQEGFGFILRTAGFDATRTELMRDAQYLTRLWQQLEKRMHAVGAPCQLYAEGDVLLRTIRDGIDGDVEAIIVDSESAFRRAKAFLEVVAPRASELLRYWDRSTPLFYAFDIERQIDLIHSREVPLPSGGALVFDQTEALVAIDVNSGRSRSARDSETNAFNTNAEAVDEICRQLRLRDLGGLVVADLIDMRSPKHRRDIEERVRTNLRKDRAKYTVAPISEFGILELTRQRMRPSMRKTHYHDCPACAGTGELRNPEAVASDAMRRLAAILDLDRVRRVEIVVGSRVAATMLSTKRRALVEIEDEFGKSVSVRISDAIPPDRADFYAYDDRDTDLELDRMPRLDRPTISKLPAALAASDDAEGDEMEESEPGEGGGRRRRRRRRKPAPADATALILAGTFDDLPDLDAAEPTVAEALKRDAIKRGQEATARAEVEARARREAKERASREELAEHERALAEARAAARMRAHQRAVGEALALRSTSDVVKVFELAKELTQASKDVLALCLEIGLGKKSHMTKLTGAEADSIRTHYGALPMPEPDAERLEALTEEELAAVDAEFAARHPQQQQPKIAGIAAQNGDDRDDAGPEQGSAQGGRKRRGRRRGRRDRNDEPSGAPSASNAPPTKGENDASSSGADASSDAPTDGAEGGARKRRRRRGGRGRSRDGERPEAGASADQPQAEAGESAAPKQATPPESEGGGHAGARRGRNRRGRGGRGGRGGSGDEQRSPREDRGAAPKDRPTPPPRASSPAPAPPPASAAAAAAPAKRGLYARNRKLAPGERPKGDDR
ncbi:MAG: Rne/Rng family ribonuclease [Phycisphaerales bacterium]|nr:Rne/Rng family ribonuclease [Phycisphaerales bacterium]